MSDRLPWFTVLCVLLAVIAAFLQAGQKWLPLLAPSDSLREASRTFAAELPADKKALSVHARPSLVYYLATNKRQHIPIP